MLCKGSHLLSTKSGLQHLWVFEWFIHNPNWSESDHFVHCPQQQMSYFQQYPQPRCCQGEKANSQRRTSWWPYIIQMSRETTWNKQVDFVWRRYLRKLTSGWTYWCKGREWGRVNGDLTVLKRSENNWTQLNTSKQLPKTNSSQMPSSYPVIDRKLLVQKGAPSWHPHAMVTGFNARAFVLKNRGGRGTAEATRLQRQREREREKIKNKQKRNKHIQ